MQSFHLHKKKPDSLPYTIYIYIYIYIYMHSVNQLLFHLLLGHALGFYHEQSRPDRDNYVTIYKQNIMQGRELSYDAYLKIQLTQAPISILENNTIMSY